MFRPPYRRSGSFHKQRPGNRPSRWATVYLTESQAVVRAVLLGRTDGIMRLLDDRILYSDIENR